jgi:hypothetical protein
VIELHGTQLSCILSAGASPTALNLLKFLQSFNLEVVK